MAAAAVAEEIVTKSRRLSVVIAIAWVGVLLGWWRVVSDPRLIHFGVDGPSAKHSRCFLHLVCQELMCSSEIVGFQDQPKCARLFQHKGFHPVDRREALTNLFQLAWFSSDEYSNGCHVKAI